MPGFEQDFLKFENILEPDPDSKISGFGSGFPETGSGFKKTGAEFENVTPSTVRYGSSFFVHHSTISYYGKIRVNDGRRGEKSGTSGV